MDAAQTTFQKIGFFLASALLVAAPLRATAPTLVASSTSVVIGSSACNDSQSLAITSSDGTNNTFSVGINYGSQNLYGNWIYTTVQGSGSTNSAATFTAQTGTTGASLVIGLNQEVATATPTATVVITPTGGTAVGSGAINITVYYTQNTSCGGNTGSASNGFVTLTPGNVSLTAGTNGTASQTVAIQNTTGSAMTFGFSVSPTNSWLAATATTTVLSANGTASVNVTASASQTSGVGSYTGVLYITPQLGTSLEIPVTFSVTNGTGGGTGTGTGGGGNTLTVNGTTSNTASIALNYVAGQAPSGMCVGLVDSAAGANSYFTQVTTTSGGNWLLANNQISTTTPQILAAGSNACVTITTSNAITGLSSGAYQGSVAITSSSGSTATITVNLYVSAGAAPGITIQPGAVFVFPNVAANSSVVQQEVFSLTGATGYVLGTASLTNAANGFSITSPVASNNTESFTLTSNSTGLAAGIYSTTVTMTSSFGNQSPSTSVITVVLPVGQAGATTTGIGGGGTSTTEVGPSSLAFEQQSTSSIWTSEKEAQAITITGAQGSSWSATIVYPAGGPSNWLNFDNPVSGSGTFGSGPATLLVDLFNGVNSLAASSTPYQATISITTTNGTYSVPVSLLVTPANTPVLIGQPAVTTFNATSGTSTPTQTVQVLGSDNFNPASSNPLLTLGTPTSSWVTGAVSGNSITLAVNASGLTTGVYTATIPVQASAYANPIQYPVVLVVNGGGGGTGTGSGSGPLTLSSSTFAFTNVTGTLSQTLNVTASTNTNFTAVSSETNCTNANWLNITNGTFTATSTATAINVQVNPTGITNGTTCAGVISLVSSSATQTVSVTMTVGASSGSGNITVTPASLSFPYTQGQTVPAAQTLNIVNTTSGTASIPLTITSSEINGTSTTWLVVSSSTGTTPDSTLSVSVVPGTLSPATYNGTVTITPSGGTAVNVPVTMTITGSAVVTAYVGTPGTTTMNLTYQVGGTSPTGTILVSGGGSAAGFTASATSNQSYLQISQTSGTTPNSGTFNLTVSVSPTVLATLLPTGTSAPYTGSVTIAGTAPATGTTIINVSLTVTAPLPVISGVTNAASYAVGAVSPGELISIYGNAANPIGPTTPVSLSSTTCPSPCTVIPQTMGGVMVKFLPSGYLAPLTYVSSGQINAIVPYEIAGQVSTSVEVLFLGQSSNAFTLNVAATAPGIFTANSSGTGPAAVLQYTAAGAYGGVNTAANPAGKGYYLIIYMTGEGKLTTNVADGAVTSSTNPAIPVIAPTGVLIGNQPATVAAYSEAPGIVSGVLQINAIVPAGAGTGPVSLSVSFAATSTQANVTVYLM